MSKHSSLLSVGVSSQSNVYVYTLIFAGWQLAHAAKCFQNDNMTIAYGYDWVALL